MKCGEVDEVKTELLEACKNLLGVYEKGGYVEAVMQVSRAVDKAEGQS